MNLICLLFGHRWNAVQLRGMLLHHYCNRCGDIWLGL